MKAAWLEFRMYLAEKLLSWAFDMAPQNFDGNELRIAIGKYFSETWVRKYNEEKKHGI